MSATHAPLSGRSGPTAAVTALVLAACALPSGNLTAAASDPIDKQVITPSMFTYLGSFRLPSEANGWSTAYSNGGLAMRYVNGNLQFFSCSHVYSGGLVYEFNYPGLATSAPYPQASVVTNWGDIYTGQKIDNGSTTLSSGCITYGLLYDPVGNGLYWTSGDWYNTAAPYNPSIGYSTLNDTTQVATGVGMWSLSNRPEHLERGGATYLPAWYATRFTNGNTLGVGFGGYYSIIGTGSLGPALATIPDPASTLPPDDSALANTPLLGYEPAGGPGFGHRTPDYQNREPPGPWSGTVQGAAASTLVLDNVNKSSGKFVDSTVAITAGPGAGQVRDIISWDFPSQTLGLSAPWTTMPVAGSSTYLVYGGYAQGGTTSTITLKATTSSHDYTGLYLIITQGTDASAPEQVVTAWDQATQTATVSPGYATPPDTTSRYEYYTSGFGTSVPDPVGGVGSWTWCDSIGGGVWIDTPDRQGLLIISQLGTGHVYYQASNIYSDGLEFEWQLFSPKDLSQVATGAMAESAVQPASMWIDPNLPPTSGATLVGGATFDATTNRLYVLIEGVWQDGTEWKPQMYVYQLAGPLNGASSGTTTGTATATGTTGTTGGSTTTGTTGGSTTAGSATSGGTAGATGSGSSGHGCGLGASLSVVLGACAMWMRRRSQRLG